MTDKDLDRVTAIMNGDGDPQAPSGIVYINHLFSVVRYLVRRCPGAETALLSGQCLVPFMDFQLEFAQHRASEDTDAMKAALKKMGVLAGRMEFEVLGLRSADTLDDGDLRFRKTWGETE